MGYELFVVYFNQFSVTCYCSSEVFSSIRNYSFFKSFKKKLQKYLRSSPRSSRHQLNNGQISVQI